MEPMLFTNAQQATLRAMLDRIIPPDAFPGAWEAGVGDYLSLQFRQEFLEIVSAYRIGLDCVDAEAQAAYRQPFCDLSFAQQEGLLTLLETQHPRTDWPFDSRRFFLLMVQHVMEGYYADPGNGGNKEGAAWAMVGFEVTA
jgi:hypothetical protein